MQSRIGAGTQFLIMKLINIKHTKEYALSVSMQCRQGKFKRVSADFLERIESKIRNIIVAEVKSHPSVGQTLK